MNRAFAVTVIVAAAATAGCKKSHPKVIARLEQMTAQVERMPQQAAPWQPAHIGDTFLVGSAVRTGPASTAILRVGKQGKLEVTPSSVVYFTRNPGREREDVRVETGAVELETGEDAIGIGEAVIEAGAHATVESSPAGTTIRIRIGRAILENNVVEQGHTITLATSGKPVVVATQRPDAGVEVVAGKVAINVRDGAARVITSAGEQELPTGAHQIEFGTIVSAPAGTTVEIARNGGRVVTSGPSQVRVTEGPNLVEVKSGNVALEGESADATATVPGGTVTARSGGAASVSVDGKDTAIDGQRGETVVKSPKGEKTLTAGQAATLAGGGEITVAAAPPATSVVTITAGESPAIHDPKAPAAIRVAFSDACPGAGTVEVSRDRTFKKLVARSGGTGAANVLVPTGAYSYRVRCAGGKGATGTLRVDRESGKTPLPKSAARTTVEMDGREYTILYQNLLPELTLAWRKAPPKPSYTFVIKPAKGDEKRLTSPSPTLKLTPGDLKEGSYSTWVEAILGARSEASRIVIEFDNAAPSAALDNVETKAGAIHVRGTAIEGSTVTAAGAAVALDKHQRFDTELHPGPGEDGVAVRISHPRAGIDYYVMRAAAP